jgi:sugar phosphate isomerase/epimerase
MITLQNYYRTTALIDECFDLLGESILICNAKDTYILPNSQTLHIQEVCPGRGVLDWETYLARMSRLDWPRMLFPEHLPAEQYPQAITLIKNTAEKIGVKMFGVG